MIDAAGASRARAKLDDARRLLWDTSLGGEDSGATGPDSGRIRFGAGSSVLGVVDGGEPAPDSGATDLYRLAVRLDEQDRAALAAEAIALVLHSGTRAVRRRLRVLARRDMAAADAMVLVLVALCEPAQLVDDDLGLFMFTGTLRDVAKCVACGRCAPVGVERCSKCGSAMVAREPSEAALLHAGQSRLGGATAWGFLVVDRGRGSLSRVDHWHFHGLLRLSRKGADGLKAKWHREHGFCRVEEVESVASAAGYVAKCAGYAAKIGRDGKSYGIAGVRTIVDVVAGEPLRSWGGG